MRKRSTGSIKCSSTGFIGGSGIKCSSGLNSTGFNSGSIQRSSIDSFICSGGGYRSSDEEKDQDPFNLG